MATGLVMICKINLIVLKELNRLFELTYLSKKLRSQPLIELMYWKNVLSSYFKNYFTCNQFSLSYRGLSFWLLWPNWDNWSAWQFFTIAQKGARSNSARPLFQTGLGANWTSEKFLEIRNISFLFTLHWVGGSMIFKNKFISFSNFLESFLHQANILP